MATVVVVMVVSFWVATLVFVSECSKVHGRIFFACAPLRSGWLASVQAHCRNARGTQLGLRCLSTLPKSRLMCSDACMPRPCALTLQSLQGVWYRARRSPQMRPCSLQLPTAASCACTSALLRLRHKHARLCHVKSPSLFTLTSLRLHSDSLPMSQ